MESRGIKRKRYEVMKNDLAVELNQLTIDSGKYITEVQAASDDFNQMFKALGDRQAELLTRSLLIQEQYSTTIDVLKKATSDTVVDIDGENVVLPANYANDINRFAADANISLKGHIALVKKEFDVMEKVMEDSDQILKKNMVELKNRALSLDKQRASLWGALNNFSRFVPQDSDEEAEED